MAVLALLYPVSVLAQLPSFMGVQEPQSLPEITSLTFPITRKFVDRNVYTVKMRMGSSPSQPVELVLATNTEWTMVTSKSCDSESGCTHGAYDKGKSTSESVSTDPIYTTINLGNPLQLTGENVTDAFYMENGVNWVDDKFPFFLITGTNDTKNLFPYDGVLGLSPDINDGDYLTLGAPIPLHLKKTNKIANAIVSIDMHQDDTHQSTMTMGGFDETKFRNKSEKYSDLKWFDVPPKTSRFAWTREVKNIFYNDKSFDDGYYNTGTFDSFFGGIHLPVAEWTNAFTEIQANLTAAGNSYLNCDMTEMKCSFSGDCSAKYGDFAHFEFNFVDDRAYTVQPKSYLLDTKDSSGRNTCLVAVYGNKYNATEYILGDVFMQSMYVILDYENSRFAVNGNYTLVDPKDSKPNRPDPKDEPASSNATLWIILGVAFGVIAIVGGYIVFRIKKRRSLEANLAKYE